jgi:DNA-directed RNA polymerase beta subunit
MSNLKSFDYSLNYDDLFMVGESEIDEKGLVSHQINSMNNLYEVGIPQMITQIFNPEINLDNKRDTTEEDRKIKRINARVKFHSVEIKKPMYTIDESSKPLYPLQALLGEKTYSSDLYVQATIKATAYLHDGLTIERDAQKESFNLCKLPTMVKSSCCNTYNKGIKELTELNEDPSDPGGYFIVKGVEWSIDNVENILFNQMQISHNPKSKELYKCSFISKPGDTYQNSDQMKLIFTSSKQLFIVIQRDDLKDRMIPFYVLFRILGWTNDKEIFDNVIMTDMSNIAKNEQNISTIKDMVLLLRDAFNANYNIGKSKKDFITNIKNEHERSTVLRALVEDINSENPSKRDIIDTEEKLQLQIHKMENSIDKFLLPHIGKDETARVEKMRFLCLCIRKLFMTYMGILPPMDRDSFKHKRIHPAGTSFSKEFKTYFNQCIVQKVIKQLYRIFKKFPFSQIDLADLVLSDIKSNNFDQKIMQAITSGTKSEISITANKSVINRLITQQLDRKNQLATYAVLRQVSVKDKGSSKQSARANEMRRVHPSYVGYICLIHSPEGEKVGLNKQMTMFSSLCDASSGEAIKSILSDDKDIMLLRDLEPIEVSYYSNVYVNGYWLGCVKDGISFAMKYRNKRRNGKIPILTTIYWDNIENEVYFWTDVGRIVRPLIIVWNNKRDTKEIGDMKSKGFKQGVKLTKQHIRQLYNRELTMQDLVQQKIVEYISAEEQENCLVCSDFEKLIDNQDNELNEFTHCEIPCSVLGITALTCPFGNHNPTVRTTYHVNQIKKSSGQALFNSLDRSDKNVFYQNFNEMPLIKTMANNYLYPSGMNCIVAIMCDTGFGQDDSIIISKGAIDRGLFNGCKMTFQKAELEPKGETFGRPQINPDGSNKGVVTKGNYSKIDDNGMINVGQRLYKNDIIIGKQFKQSKLNEEDVYNDTSVLYKNDESAVVHNVIRSINESGVSFCKVVMRHPRSVIIGDKFSILMSDEILTHKGWMQLKDIEPTKHKVATLREGKYLEYVNPVEKWEYEHKGKMYDLKSQQVEILCTPNHKLYVKRRDHNNYEFIEAQNVFGKRVKHKKNAINDYPNQDNYKAYDNMGNFKEYPMNAWLQMLGMFIADGWTSEKHNKSGDMITFSAVKQRKRNFINEFCEKLQIRCRITDTKSYISGSEYPEIYDELKKLSVGALNKSLPDYVWSLSQDQSRILLNALISGDGSYNNNGSAGYYTSSEKLANDVSRLALHAGWSGTIKNFNENSGKRKGDTYTIYKNGVVSHSGTLKADCLYVRIVKCKNEPQINHGHVHEQKIQEEKYTHYDSIMVGCIEVPKSHVFYTRRNKFSPSVWLGNSSRAGQKGICALMMDDSDLPFTKNGERPSIIFNPSGIPSRKTISQIFESLTGNLCALKGTTTDATMFRKYDVRTVMEELKELGFDEYGEQKLYNGITGEAINSKIFIGPVYYQRLQHFLNDKYYVVERCATDEICVQKPLNYTGFLYLGSNMATYLIRLVILF